jgi:hypothetical protein
MGLLSGIFGGKPKKKGMKPLKTSGNMRTEIVNGTVRYSKK